MADSIREQILQLVKERFQTISVANGYETNLGTHVYLFRDLSRSPFAETELPAVNIIDLDEQHQPKVSGRANHHHVLSIECQIAAGVTAAGGNTDAAKQVRKCISDLIKAIGTETNGANGHDWANDTPSESNPSGTALAFNSLPIANQIGLEQADRTIGVGIYKFDIEYRTQRWNPYEQ